MPPAFQINRDAPLMFVIHGAPGEQAAVATRAEIEAGLRAQRDDPNGTGSWTLKTSC